MNLEPKEKYKLEYAEVGHLRRHYSTVRSGLTMFCMTTSLAAFSSYIAQPARSFYLVFIGFFMLIVALLACLVFSYHCEKANLYAALLWRWFDGEERGELPGFCQYTPGCDQALRQMCRDEMNWLMLVGALTIASSLCLSR
jgi:hypothetical protein